MFKTIQNLEAVKARREEEGEGGFSLIELIVVVVILGILAAIAVPVFLGLQDQAEKQAVATQAANGASQVAADIAKATTAPTAESLVAGLSSLATTGGVVFTVAPATGIQVDNFCVRATKGTDSSTSGPGCATNSPATPAAD